ncbi:MAG: sulfurtransferase [Myxococcota bacterium]|nr:sulfurtransferase [Myxococcota bacterium]
MKVAVSGKGSIVSTEWLARNLGAPGIRVVDIRGSVRPPGNQPRYVANREDYLAAHVPGAVFVDWTRDVVDLDDPVPVQIAKPEAFAAKMSELGIGDGTLVIVYDDYHHIFAGRLAWALLYHGHDAVRVLDGGWSRWRAEARPTSRDLPVHGAASSTCRFTPKMRPALRKTADEVQRCLRGGDALLLDARPRDQFLGVATAAQRSGHIPGARNVPYTGIVDPTTGKFRPVQDLIGVFAEGGVDVTRLPREVIVYCNGGVSCSVLFQSLRLLGRDDIAVYDGSWNEWGNDPDRPIEREESSGDEKNMTL